MHTRFLKTNIFVLICIPLLLLAMMNSCYYSERAAQKLWDKSKDEVYDVVVVPGVPFEDGKWSWIMRGRVYWSKYLYDKGVTKNIMFSGSSVYSPYYEAKIMAMYAEAIGIPKENIYIETRAEHSTENIYYSYHKAQKMGFKKIALASDPFQTRSLKRFTRTKVSKDVALIPMVIDTMKIIEPTMIDPVIDSLKAYNKDFVSIKKRESSWKRFKGTLGYNIKKEKTSSKR